MSENLHGSSTIAALESGVLNQQASREDDSMSTSHRVSMISSVSSGSVSTPSMISQPLSKLAPSSGSLKRTVSSMSTGESTSTQLEYSREFKHHKSDPDHRDRRLTRLDNARILQKDGSLLRGSITVDPESGLIVEISLDADEAGEEKHEEALLQIFGSIDCKGQIVSPGFIDIQLNGAYGVDFSNAQGLNIEDVLLVARRLLASGVTSFCPTMVSSSRETYRRVIPLIRKARKHQSDRTRHNQENTSATILGMHLEGPFFALSKRGAHDSKHIVAPSKGMKSVREAYGFDASSVDADDDEHHLREIDIITMAPELDGASEAIRSLTNHQNSDDKPSIVISCGHTEASYEDGIKALSDGATLLTHLFNAMNPFHHRQPGLVGLLSSELKLARLGLNRPYYSMIVDGIHVHESAVCMAYNSHPHGCVLVTDAMAAMGLGDGKHSLGDMSVFLQGDRATILGTDTLAGSVVSMDTCVRRFKQCTDCSIGEALLCATLHPAMVLKRHIAKRKDILAVGDVDDASIGVLEVGAAADLVLLNDDLEVLGTWVRGKNAFEQLQKQN
ncbi:hypothetical protein HJC23_012819 [Cyclotella cryptica]|uniref:N-acetylglucosamine-6-phosphate deacetylase n=1 Tax=Cyclotella cryptica TaxID=29204 RepID=A0ABD3NZ68_9STRA|eukprot:CCRYP_018608-RA/>CCRYP_018608-RA protein AED:0.01 eAED:0.01 QI:313/1/1/1/1/1/2/56/559